MCHIFFIHSSVNGHLGCFHVLAIVNSAAMNIVVHDSFLIMVFSGYVPSSGIAGLYGSSIFTNCIFYFLSVEREKNYSFTFSSCHLLQDSPQLLQTPTLNVLFSSPPVFSVFELTSTQDTQTRNPQVILCSSFSYPLCCHILQILSLKFLMNPVPLLHPLWKHFNSGSTSLELIHSMDSHNLITGESNSLKFKPERVFFPVPALSCTLVEVSFLDQVSITFLNFSYKE